MHRSAINVKPATDGFPLLFVRDLRSAKCAINGMSILLFAWACCWQKRNSQIWYWLTCCWVRPMTCRIPPHLHDVWRPQQWKSLQQTHKRSGRHFRWRDFGFGVDIVLSYARQSCFVFHKKGIRHSNLAKPKNKRIH